MGFILLDYSTLLTKISKYEKIKKETTNNSGKKIKKNKFNIKVIGTTYYGRSIFAVKQVKKTKLPTAILVASIHARENITTDLLCKMIDENLFDGITKFNISFILMANPDGVELSKNGLKNYPKSSWNYLLQLNENNSDFSLWKSNARGVDLNNNFDAKFGTNSHSNCFSSHGFSGLFAESEEETKAIVAYTKKVKPFITISYHSKGEEIYFNFFQTNSDLKRDEIIAKRFAESTGYAIKNVENSSSGGYKDYCVSKLNIPALTIEVGSDNLSHPISEKYLDEIYEKNKNIVEDLNFALSCMTAKK